MPCAGQVAIVVATHKAQDQKLDCVISLLFRSQVPASCPSKESPVSARLSNMSVCMSVAIFFLLAEELSLRAKEVAGF